MSKRPPIKTTAEQAINYWIKYIDEGDLSVDWAEADTHCWRCGYQRNLERCHIVPDSLGGPDTPSNIVMLCKRCHADGPNVNDPEIMWDWIRAYKVLFYETFWHSKALKEYQFIYKNSFKEDLIKVLASSGRNYTNEEISDIIRLSLDETIAKASNHFGQPYFNTATLAGMYRMVIKKIAKDHGVSEI